MYVVNSGVPHPTGVSSLFRETSSVSQRVAYGEEMVFVLKKKISSLNLQPFAQFIYFKYWL